MTKAADIVVCIVVGVVATVAAAVVVAPILCVVGVVVVVAVMIVTVTRFELFQSLCTRFHAGHLFIRAYLDQHLNTWIPGHMDQLLDGSI